MLTARIILIEVAVIRLNPFLPSYWYLVRGYPARMGISLDLPTESPYHRIPLISGYPEERTKK
jgi:hypothetical protein